MEPVFRTIVILCFSVLFASSAAHKIQNRPLFHEQLTAYGLLPGSLIGLAVWTLPVFELVLSAALLISFMTPLALSGTALLLLFYGLVMEITIRRGRRDIDCGCSGVEGTTPVSRGLVGRNALLAVIAVAASLPYTPRTLSFSDQALCVLVGLTVTAFYQAANQLMANGPSLKAYRTA